MVMTQNTPPNAAPAAQQQRVRIGEYTVTLIHFNNGWRHWAFHRCSGQDVERGLDPNGYASLKEAQRAVARAQKAGSR